MGTLFVLQFECDQGYRRPRPVTARQMSIRWISEVPSTMVKLSDVDTRD